MDQFPNLLIVDDRKENLFLLETIIRHFKVNLIKALSGVEALEKTRGLELALAIIDVRMPEMDGYELAMNLNQERTGDKVPVIFLTAEYFNDSEVSKGYDSGAVDYIFKPINRQILLSKIRVFLDLFGQKQTIVANTLQLTKYAGDLKSSLNQLQQLSKYIEKSRENERKAMARELHDDLGQALTAVKMDLGIIKQRVADQDLTSRILKASDLVEETIKTVQRLTSQLRPDIIDDLGLEAAIKWYTKEFSQRNGIEIYLDMDSEIPLSPDDSLTVFRIMQESLTNVARHSQASRVEINFSNDNGIIQFKISDNGVGIKDEGLNSKKSFGIIGMKERASSLAGSCNIYSTNGEGTIIHLTFPLDKKMAYEDFNL